MNRAEFVGTVAKHAKNRQSPQGPGDIVDQNILFPEEVKSQTLSGLFMYQLDRIPKVGDEIEESGYRFTVKSMSGQRVDKVRIEQVHETKSEESKGDEAPQSAPE